MQLVLSVLFLACFSVEGQTPAVGAFSLALLFELFCALKRIRTKGLPSASRQQFVETLGERVAHFGFFLAFISAPSVRGEPWPVLLLTCLFFRDPIVIYTRTFAASETRGNTISNPTEKLRRLIQGFTIVLLPAFRVVSGHYPSLQALRPRIFYLAMTPLAALSLMAAMDCILSNRKTYRKLARDGN